MRLSGFCGVGWPDRLNPSPAASPGRFTTPFLPNLNHVTNKTFTVAELRAVLGVPDGRLKRWNDVNNFALTPAIAEINQTSRLTLTATPRKVGRTVASVTTSWEEKPLEQKQHAKRELDRPKVGRKARREGRLRLQR